MNDELNNKPKYKRAGSYSKSRLRNLTQYRNMSDEQFEETFAQKSLGIMQNKEFEERIEHKLKDFSSDYELDDMNINDRLILRALCQAMITLEDMELAEYSIRKEGINEDNILLLDKLGKLKSDLRSDISKLQDDLKITRRVRKADKEQSVINYIEDLKKKAKEFYTAKMGIVICDKCHTWIGSAWFLYPESNNKMKFTCKRRFIDGTFCKGEVNITSKELLEMGGCNLPEYLPESLK